MMLQKIILIKVILFIVTTAQELPSSFDLRQVGDNSYVTAVKSQFGGTCWTHGVMASIESQLLISGTWEKLSYHGEPDFAEYHLDWWNGFNQHFNEDHPFTGEELTIHMGGDYRVTAAYISRGEGPVLENDEDWYENPPDRYSEAYDDFYVNHIEWLTVHSDSLRIELIKHYLMENGAIATAYAHYDEFLNGDDTFYQPRTDSNDPNHSVTIVGWDDNKNTLAPKSGAWLIKNSWGTGWGLDGYFWISFYDKHCGVHPDMGAVSFIEIERQPYDRFYYHDYHGWRDTDTLFHRGYNAFQILGNGDSPEWLKAVSIITPLDCTEVTINIYSDFNNGLTGLLTSEQDFYEIRGFHTLQLNDTIRLEPEDSFFVEVILSKNGMAFDRSSDVPVLLPDLMKDAGDNWIISTASAGQSFVWDTNNEEWLDYYALDSSANICVKAITVFTDPATAIDESFGRPEGFTLNQNYPNPFNPSTVISYQLPVVSEVSVHIYNSLGQKVRTLFTGRQQMGFHELSWNGKDGLGRAVSSGIYFYNLKTEDFSQTKKMLLLK